MAVGVSTGRGLESQRSRLQRANTGSSSHHRWRKWRQIILSLKISGLDQLLHCMSSMKNHMQINHKEKNGVYNNKETREKKRSHVGHFKSEHNAEEAWGFCLDNILTKYRGLLASQVPHPSCVELGNLCSLSAYLETWPRITWIILTCCAIRVANDFITLHCL